GPGRLQRDRLSAAGRPQRAARGCGTPKPTTRLLRSLPPAPRTKGPPVVAETTLGRRVPRAWDFAISGGADGLGEVADDPIVVGKPRVARLGRVEEPHRGVVADPAGETVPRHLLAVAGEERVDRVRLVDRLHRPCGQAEVPLGRRQGR